MQRPRVNQRKLKDKYARDEPEYIRNSRSVATHLHLIRDNRTRTELGANLISSEGVEVAEADGLYKPLGLEVPQVLDSRHVASIGVVLPVKLLQTPPPPETPR